MKKGWTDYYKVTKNNPPTKILVESLDHLSCKKGEVLELGAGSPKDTVFLLKQGFNVTAVDKSTESEGLFKDLKDNNFEFILSSFSDFDFSKDKYVLVSAQRSLPFIESKDELEQVFKSIKESLKEKGVFVGHFFGSNDTWCKEGKKMTFVNKEEILNFLDDFEIKLISEKEEDSQTANGTPHHWHVFEVIAVRRS